MATARIKVSDVTLISGWYEIKRTISGSGGLTYEEYYLTNPTSASEDRSFSLSGIPAGSIINSASLNATRENFAKKNGTMDGVSGSTNSGAIAIAASRITPGGSLSIKFAYKANSSVWYETGTVGYKNAKAVWKDITLTVNYTPYTSCKAPTSVTAAATNVAPGATVRLSWSGAQAGTNNPIKSYTVYRSSDGSNWSVLKSGVTNQYLDVTAPTANGADYQYKVAAIGTASGYDSAMSSVKVSVKCSYTAPSVSDVTVDGSSAAVYKAASAATVLSWTGTNGTNNAIAKYEVYNGGTKLGETTGTTYSVTAPAAGNSAVFTVKPIGTYSDGTGVASPTLYGYSAPSAPASVAVSKTNVAPGAAVTLSWSGAAAGRYCDIIGYRIMRADAADGDYTQFGEDIVSTETSGSVRVTSPGGNNTSYYYKVITLGARANSAPSAYAALTTHWTVPTAFNVKLDGSSADIYRPAGEGCTLTWESEEGPNNPIQKFHVYRGSAKIGETTERSYAVTANETAGSYNQYKVKPIGALENGDYSPSIRVYTYSAPAAPDSVAAGNATPDAGTNTTITWSGAQNGSYNEITGYRVFRATAADGVYTQLGSDLAANVTSLTVTAPAEMGASYYYRVMPLGQRMNGGMSAAYAAVTAQTYTVPTAPVSVSVAAGVVDAGTSTTLSWSDAADGTNNPITGYRVMRSAEENGVYEQYGSDVAANVSSISVPAPATMGRKYFYRVIAIGTKGGFLLSAPSAAVQVAAQNYTACAAPTAVQLSKALANPGDTVTVSWSGAQAGTNNPIAGYNVYRSSGGTYTLFAQVDSETSSVTDTVGASGTKYSYKIIARGTKSGFNSGDSAIVTVTANTPPAKVLSFVMPPLIYESGSLAVSWTPPADDDRNIAHYSVQRRIRDAGGTWGSWTDLPDVTAAAFADQPTVGRGLKFQYRVCAVDTLGLAGEYAETDVLTRNSLPLTPTVLHPAASGATTYDLSPILYVSCPADPDKQSLTLLMAVDGGEYASVASISAAKTLAVKCPAILSAGTHTLSVILRDSLGADSEAASVTVAVAAASLGRTIARGTVISTNAVSHQAEIALLYQMVNTVRAYFGVEAIAVPEAVGELYANAGDGKIGMFAAWGSQMLALQNAIADVYAVLGIAPTAFPQARAGMAPAADVINGILNAVLGL